MIILMLQQEFRCDTCLLERTHVDCEDVTCGVCRDVAATLEARWILRSRQEEEDKENIDTTSESRRKQGNTQELQKGNDSATVDTEVSDSEVDKTDPGEEDGDEDITEEDGESQNGDKD